jgi:hypothetical protein
MAVDYVPFATGGGANVYSPATYQALAVVATGVQPGLADPQLANTTWRLASVLSAAVANFISNALGGISILDDGNVTTLTANMAAAVGAGALISASRTITSSANFNILITDGAIAMARVAGVAPTTATLPSTAAVGQKFKIGDVIGNFQANPVTVAAPGGHNIAGLASVVLGVNRKTAEFQYHGGSTWSVQGVF